MAHSVLYRKRCQELVAFFTIPEPTDIVGITSSMEYWRNIMTWAETIVQSLKDWDTPLIAYVPDISIDRVTSLIAADPFFHLVSCTREEEAIGIAVGSYKKIKSRGT